MKFSLALAQDLPLLIGDRVTASLIARAWELRKGGLAWVNAGSAISPSAEAHVVAGTIEGEGPWTLTPADGSPPLTIYKAERHAPRRGEVEGCLGYLAFWFPDLHRVDLILD